MERNLRLAREFNEELRIMKERSRIDSDEFDNIFGDRVYDRYKQNIDVVRTSLEELEKVRERILSRGEENISCRESGEAEPARDFRACSGTKKLGRTLPIRSPTCRFRHVTRPGSVRQNISPSVRCFPNYSRMAKSIWTRSGNSSKRAEKLSSTWHGRIRRCSAKWWTTGKPTKRH